MSMAAGVWLDAASKTVDARYIVSGTRASCKSLRNEPSDSANSLTHQPSNADPLHCFNLVVEPRSLSAEIILVDVTRLLDNEIK